MEVRVVDHPLAAARLTWSDTSSKSGRPAKDFESCETVSIAESAQCPLVRCSAQPVNRESRKGISEIEGKAVRVAASESGSRTSFNRENGIPKMEGTYEGRSDGVWQR